MLSVMSVDLRSGDAAFASMLEAAQAGAPWACTQIWVEHAPAVAAFLSARGSREAEDLTSEVFLAVFSHLHDFRGDRAAFRSFVFSIAYRRLVDELRMRARRGEADEWTPDRDPRQARSAEDDAIVRLGTEKTRQLLDGLPADQRDVMVLRIVADLTVEQIAAVLDKRPGAVKALQRRALENLRKKVGSTRTPGRAEDDSSE
jgi:RNA polymerase sigma-70 factor, ECF subfamily